MSDNYEFDKTLETWLRHQAPQQAPDRVLDAALERVQVEPQRRSWRQRVFGGTSMTNMTRIAAVAAAVVIATLVAVQLISPTIDIGPSPNPSPSAEPSESSAPASPAASAVSSPEPSAGALVAHLVGGGELGPFHLATIFDDGRVITSDPSAVTAPLQRRLTAAGIQLVRDEMAATGLTDAPANFQPVPNPGVEPPGGIGTVGQLEIAQAGGGTVIVTWNLYADTEADYFQPQPEAEALQALSVRLTTLDEWLPAAAWAEPNPIPYAPDGYRITISSSEWGGSLDELPPEVATLVWPVDLDRTDLDDVLGSRRDETRCRLIDAAEGTAVIEALQAAGAAPEDGTNLSFRLGERETPRTITFTVAPLMPFDVGVC